MAAHGWLPIRTLAVCWLLSAGCATVSSVEPIVTEEMAVQPFPDRCTITEPGVEDDGLVLERQGWQYRVWSGDVPEDEPWTVSLAAAVEGDGAAARDLIVQISPGDDGPAKYRYYFLRMDGTHMALSGLDAAEVRGWLGQDYAVPASSEDLAVETLLELRLLHRVAFEVHRESDNAVRYRIDPLD